MSRHRHTFRRRVSTTTTTPEQGNQMHGIIPPPDDAAHQDSVLIAELAEVNNLISRYILRFLDGDANRAEPPSAEDERALVERATKVLDTLRARAERREHV